MEREDSLCPYLGTKNGIIDLFAITLLNITAFITIVDREPSGLTGRRSALVKDSTSTSINGSTFPCNVQNSSQGLYVFPSDACFPIDSTLESYLFVIYAFVLVLMGVALTKYLGRRNIMQINMGICKWDLNSEIEYHWWYSTSILAGMYILILIIDMYFLNGMGIDRSPEDEIIPNITYLLLFGYHIGSVAIPFGVYTLSLFYQIG